MIGRRIYSKEGEQIFRTMQPGDYFKADDGFVIMTPNGLVASIRNHKVIEHEDGTITASPSILINGTGTWHGFLEKGIWREV